MFDYIYDHANAAGVWKLDLLSAQRMTGMTKLIWMEFIQELNQAPKGFPAFVSPIRLLQSTAMWIVPYVPWRRGGRHVLLERDTPAIRSLIAMGLWPAFAETFPEMLPYGCSPTRPPDWAVRLRGSPSQGTILDRIGHLESFQSLSELERAELLSYVRSPQARTKQKDLPKLIENWLKSRDKAELLELRARIARIAHSIKSLQQRTYLPPGAQFPKLEPEAAQQIKHLNEERHKIENRLSEIQKRNHKRRRDEDSPAMDDHPRGADGGISQPVFADGM